MKKVTAALAIVVMLLAGCGDNNLGNEEACKEALRVGAEAILVSSENTDAALDLAESAANNDAVGIEESASELQGDRLNMLVDEYVYLANQCGVNTNSMESV